MRFPAEVVEYLDLLVERQRQLGKPAVGRSEIIGQLLQRMNVPATKDAMFNLRLQRARDAAFPE